MKNNLTHLVWSVIRNRISPSQTPYFCTYSVTWRCNASCKMCSIWQKEDVSEMRIAEIEKTFRAIPSITGVRITGGEPFLRDDLSAIVDCINKNTRSAAIFITTNGILTDKVVSFFEDVRYKTIRLKISLNGYGKTNDEVMGQAGAFQKTVATIERLKSVQCKYGFYLGINHTIFNRASYEDSRRIRLLCKNYGLSYMPCFAYGEVPLYTGRIHADRIKDPMTERFGSFGKEELNEILHDLIPAADSIDSRWEKIFKKYYLNGLYKRLVLGKYAPGSRCVVLKNHIRILPDGSVPVCLYNSNIVGNIVHEDFSGLWHGVKISEMRNWVNNCKGCWQQCDIFPNLVWSGDIIFHLLRAYLV